MTRAEAQILAEYAGIAFYIPDEKPGLVGNYICLVRRGDKLEDEGEHVGPHRFYVKWDATKCRSLLNETYQKGLHGTLSGQFHASKLWVLRAPEGSCAHCSGAEEVFKCFLSREAPKVAEALNLALKLGKEAAAK
jgi:hypothetical protein